MSYTQDGEVRLFSALDDDSSGDIRIHGTVRADGEQGSVAAIAAGLGTSTGDLRVDGEVSAGSEVLLGAAMGNVTIDRSARVTVSGSDGLIEALASYGENGRGDLRVDGELTARGDSGSIVLGASRGTDSRGDVAIKGSLESDHVAVFTGRGEGASGSVRMDGRLSAKSTARLRSGNGNVSVDGDVNVSGRDGLAEIVSSSVDGSKGDVKIGGSVLTTGEGARTVVAAGYGTGSSGDIVVDGRISSNKGSVLLYAGKGQGAAGDVSIGGRVEASKTSSIVSGDGDVAIGGRVSGGDVVLWANGSTTAGNVKLSKAGLVVARDSASVVASGSMKQNGNLLSVQEGQVPSEDLNSAIKAEKIVLKVGEDVGRGTGNPVGVVGRVFAVVEGNASFAAAAGTDFQGGEVAAAPSVQALDTVGQTIRGLKLENKVMEIDGTTETLTLSGVSMPDYHLEGLSIKGLESDFSGLGGNAALIVGGDLSIYTAGKLEPNGLLQAGGDITVSAGAFGDLSYLRAGGTLHVNNVGRPSHPLLAYFETVNGVTPKIANQPNDVVVFIDGRLAGGNIQTMNRLGSIEAFPVETPELKSVQGVFGNPTFIHGDLDVSEPVGIGVVDYLLVDRARMSYGADIPPEMDMQVSVNGLSPLYSYWFGQHAAKRASAGLGPRRGVAASD